MVPLVSGIPGAVIGVIGGATLLKQSSPSQVWVKC